MLLYVVILNLVKAPSAAAAALFYVVILTLERSEGEGSLYLSLLFFTSFIKPRAEFRYEFQ
jgi:hypothetical protein